MLNHEPIQYILGETIFYGLNISVAKDVLIPRHETEELAEWLIGAHEFEQETIDIIDIGCGSGCLSVAIKNNLPRATVSGIDVSEAALELSKINAKKHNLDICFKLQNIFDDNFKWIPRKSLLLLVTSYVLKVKNHHFPKGLNCMNQVWHCLSPTMTLYVFINVFWSYLPHSQDVLF